jgi:phosphatidylglycerol:prolipoprotein diacylglycerol transferase
VFSEYNDGTPGWSYYQQHPIEIITGIRTGGMGIFGGVVGGAIGAIIVAFRKKVPLGIIANAIAPGLLLGQAIGRFGNFANQELYGPPTTLPWGVRIAEFGRVAQYRDLISYPIATTFFHPTFFYEALWNVIGLGFLLWFARRFKTELKAWDTFGIYLVWYGAGRAVLESTLRLDASTYGSGPLPTAVLFGLAFIAAGIVILVANRLIRPHNGVSAAVTQITNTEG